MSTLLTIPPVVSVPHMLQELADGVSVRIVDARCDPVDGSGPGAGRRAWLAGHLPGAVHLDLDEDLSGPANPALGRHPLPDPAVLAGTLASLGLSAHDRIVIHDAAEGSLAAARAWWLLVQLGYSRVSVLDGGLAAWLAHGRPLEAGPVQTSPVRPGNATFRRGGWVDTEEVAQRTAQQTGWLIDARAPLRFAGQHEPIDRFAGHVPGAVNLPFGNLVASGRLLPPERLRERIATALGGLDMAGKVVMCGSGVTACHLLLAFAHAGLEGARLYPASWSGWSSDPHRPRAMERSP